MAKKPAVEKKPVVVGGGTIPVRMLTKMDGPGKADVGETVLVTEALAKNWCDGDSGKQAVRIDPKPATK